MPQALFIQSCLHRRSHVHVQVEKKEIVYTGTCTLILYVTPFGQST